ncbi:hypothetical protein BH09ACT8_BH09ACT8_49870 [soil metagenome]
MDQERPQESPDEPSGEPTRIIRRNPTGPIAKAPTPALDDTRTGIIRRAPTGAIPVVPDTTHTTNIPRPSVDEAQTGLLPRAKPLQVPRTRRGLRPSATTAVSACVVAILSGWATSVVSTDLITGWWDTDRLFCAAVGFLALVFAASTTTGVILLLLGRQLGRFLIALGAVVALLAFAGVFIAGAKIPWTVYTIPVLPIISAALALHPSTKRWVSST